MISLNLSFSRVEWLYIIHIYWLKKGWFPAQTWILTIVNRFLMGLKLSKVMKIGFYWHTVISRLSLWGQLPADNTMYVFHALHVTLWQISDLWHWSSTEWWHKPSCPLPRDNRRKYVLRQPSQVQVTNSLHRGRPSAPVLVSFLLWGHRSRLLW